MAACHQDCTHNLMRCSTKTCRETSSVRIMLPPKSWLVCVREGFTLEVKNRSCEPPALVVMYLGTGKRPARIVFASSAGACSNERKPA